MKGGINKAFNRLAFAGTLALASGCIPTKERLRAPYQMDLYDVTCYDQNQGEHNYEVDSVGHFMDGYTGAPWVNLWRDGEKLAAYPLSRCPGLPGLDGGYYNYNGYNQNRYPTDYNTTGYRYRR